MPCRCDYDEAPTPTVSKTTYDKVVKELDQTTRLLCDLTRNLPMKYIVPNPELKKWVEDHAEMDRQRLQKERIEQKQKELEIQEKIKKLQADLDKVKKGKK